MGGALDGRGLKPVRLVCCDIDGTVAGDPAAEARFGERWSRLAPHERPFFVLNSGRLIEDQKAFLLTSPLPRPDVLIGGVGTMLWSSLDPGHTDSYAQSIGPAFDGSRIAEALRAFAGIRPQASEFQHAHKSSWQLHDADEALLAEIEAGLATAGLNARLVYSSARDLDILPAGVDKGAALAWLCGRLGLGLDEVVVAGDTGNDLGMFELEGIRGIVVANAYPELRAFADNRPNIYRASQPTADGVIEGLEHFGVLHRPHTG